MTVPTLYEMLESISESIAPLSDLAITFAYLTGLTLIIGALYKLRMHGDYRAMMTAGVDIKGPVGAIIFGAFLIWLPSSMQTISTTFWGVGEPIGYDPASGSMLDEGIAVCMEIIAFVGLLAFIRGLMQMSRLGAQGNQPGNFAKALTHIFGGILAFHLGATIDVIRNTLGF